MKSRIKSKILDNFVMKLVSVLIAFVLWLVVMNVSDSMITVKIKGIPVQQINGAALEELDKVYDVAKGDTVDIVVKGRRSIVEGLDVDDFIATADLSTMSITNTVQITVTSKNGGIRDEISITCVDNVMRLNLEEKISLQYSVKVKTIGNAKSGYAVCGYQTSPNIITIEGPKSAVEKVTEVDVKVDVNNASSAIDLEGAIVLYDAYGDEINNDKISVSQETVKVHVDIYPTKEVPVEVDINGTPREGYTMSEVLYQPQTVNIAGDPSDLENIEKIVVNDVYISGMDSDLETAVTLKDYLPDNVYLENAGEEVVITVGIEKLVSKVIVLTAEDISILQKTSNKDYYLELSDDFVVVITGLDSTVEEITIDKLNPKIFSKDMSIGTHNDVQIDLTEIDGITYEIKGTAKLTISAK
ncbi:MAG: hypothetical protein IJO70_03805 [Lachnospiraceae bacterium]|nr:hypothetical protein [Lachnospiraceae bacterium]